MPTAEFLMEVGNSSAVNRNTMAKAADEPNFPISEKTSRTVKFSTKPAMMQDEPLKICTNIRNGFRPQSPTD